MGVEVFDLTRTYGSINAADHVTFGVEYGQIFGLLGRNGAGKTTVISMLTTLLAPTSGSGTVASYDIFDEQDKIRKSVGIVFQESILDSYLTGMQNLIIAALLRGMTRIAAETRASELMSLVGLQGRERDVVQKYSGGMRRRLEIARALLTQPKIVFMDEPTLGLDPSARRSVWDYIRRVRDIGSTVVLTTHYMDEAERLCDKVAIIECGKIVANDSPSTLVSGLGGDIVKIKIKHTSMALKLLKDRGITSKSYSDDQITVDAGGRGEEAVPRILSILYSNGLEVESVYVKRPSLDDVFVKFTGTSNLDESNLANQLAHIFSRRSAGGFG